MGYRENVQALCDRLDLPNPIREEDLTVSSISFRVDGTWERIEGTETNRAGRLFFQDGFKRYGSRPYDTYVYGTEVLHKASLFFAENWHDSEEKGRPMLIAFKKGERLMIRWK